MRIMLLTHYYPPEIGAAQTRLSETVAELQHLGHTVTVVAPIPHYPHGRVPAGYHSWRPLREHRGAPTVRLPVLARGGDRFANRVASQASFAVTSVASAGLARRHDVVLVESPPLPLAVSGRIIARAASRPYVLHVADPWPDFPIAMGYLRNEGLRRLAYAMEAFAYSGASAITTVTPMLVELLNRKPGAIGKVRHLPNSVSVDRFEAAPDREESRRRLGWDPSVFTVVYAGTLGAAQGMGTAIEAARRVREPMSIRLIGDGIERADLERRAHESGARWVSFDAPIPRSEVPRALAAADAGLVMLRDGPLYEASLPTKLVETMAAGRAVVVAARGTAASIVESSGAGYVVPPEDAASLAEALVTACHDPQRDARGERGRLAVRRSYDRPVVIRRLASILADAISGS
jgi:glycosyltransferase involved in cell wall biosynthesis